MDSTLIDRVTATIATIQTRRPLGRVIGVAGGTLVVSGLNQHAGLGDPVTVLQGAETLKGEVVKLGDGAAYILIDGATDGIRLGDPVRLEMRRKFAPDDSWIGRVIDPDGLPLDGRKLLPGLKSKPLQAPPPSPHLRRAMGERIETGIAVFNTLLPIVRGQRIGLFAGSGVGKSTLIADLARRAEADVIVIALVGERGREVRHFIDEVLGPEGMKRAIVVAATSDRAPQTRRRCAWAAMAVAEHFRDLGLHVMLFVDSVTRYCEAHREIAVAGGEPAALRGFPASTGPAIAGLCERAGPGEGVSGDITAVFSVLVAGSDMDEPIADMLRGVLDGHVILERSIAERGRFPAVDVLRSVSRSLPTAANGPENVAIAQARGHLGAYDTAALMVQSGLYVSGSDPKVDAAIACQPALDRFLSVQDDRGTDVHFTVLRQALAAGGSHKESS